MKKYLSLTIRLIIVMSVMLPFVFGGESTAEAQTSESPGMLENFEFSSLTAGNQGTWFVHTANTSNISSNFTYIDHPLTNNNPDAIIHVTQNWNPGGVGSTYNDHSIGVWYDGFEDQWAIFNQDISAMPVGAAFNVMIPSSDITAIIHTATGGNIVNNYTLIDHPVTNNNPDANILVTQNWNPSGDVGVYNDHIIGVWYSNFYNKWSVYNQDLASMTVEADFNVMILPADNTSLVHTAIADNSSGHFTYIDHPLTNNNPNAIVLVTQNWNPGGSLDGVYNDHSIGVWYSQSNGKWSIFNQDFGGMSDGSAFNVMVPTNDTGAFIHTATASNILDNFTLIDHPLTNGNPNAILFVTQNWNPEGGVGIYNNHTIGVWYSSFFNKWSIFNQDLTAMTVGSAFNVYIPVVDSSVFVHFARSGNITSNWTDIDYPLTNNNPEAMLLITQNWNPSGFGGVYNDQPIGVWYHSVEDKWAVFNQSLANMPVDAAFNVMVLPSHPDAFLHTATVGNISGNYTVIDHPRSNNNLGALILVTQNWNPGGVVGSYNDHPIGVWYSNSLRQWSIFNQDNEPMPVDAKFNVLVLVKRLYLPTVFR